MITLSSNMVNVNEFATLYNDAGWISYTKDLDKLEKAAKNSLRLITAWDRDKLIELIRAIGDGLTIIYIQDLIVLSQYQRRGIGTRLINSMLREYEDVGQTILITDNETNTVAFYKSVGLTPIEDYNGIGFVKYSFKD